MVYGISANLKDFGKEVRRMTAIPDTKKFITTSELKELGYSYYKIEKLEETGNDQTREPHTV